VQLAVSVKLAKKLHAACTLFSVASVIVLTEFSLPKSPYFPKVSLKIVVLAVPLSRSKVI
jgi:hypothetical protein